MQPCPLPTLDTTLAEVNRVLTLLLPPDDYETYTNALSSIQKHTVFQEIVTNVHQHFVSLPTEDVDDFTTLLLSQRSPLFYTLLVTVILSLPSSRRDQVGVASELLARLALITLNRHAYFSTTSDGTHLEQDQPNRFLATTHVVGKDMDSLSSFPDSRHVTIWINGQAFALDIIDASRAPKSSNAIERSLREMMDLAATTENGKISVASLSWNLSRPVWFETRRSIQLFEESAQSLVTLERAIASIALEPFAPASEANILENLRSGRGSVNRYADNVLGIVVYSNGTAGLAVDHTPVDGSLPILLANALVPWEPTLSPSDDGEKALYRSLPFHIPSTVSTTDGAYQDTPRIVRTISLGASLSSHVAESVHRSRLVPFLVQIAMQSALRSVKDALPKNPLVVQPVSMRHFKGGRADPSLPATAASVALVDALYCSGFDATNIQHKSELSFLFADAFKSHKRLVKEVKLGASVGPHLDALYTALAQDIHISSLPEARTILDAWDWFSGITRPVVSITGFMEAKGVKGAMANIYAPHQLIGWYTGHLDTTLVSFSIAGTGVFYAGNVVERIASAVITAYHALAEIGADYVSTSGSEGLSQDLLSGNPSNIERCCGTGTLPGVSVS